MSTTIKDLERKVQSLKDQLEQAKKSLLQARLDAFPVKIGDIVRITADRHRGELCKVTVIEPEWKWLKGNVKRKDGSWGERDTALYSEWEVQP